MQKSQEIHIRSCLHFFKLILSSCLTRFALCLCWSVETQPGTRYANEQRLEVLQTLQQLCFTEMWQDLLKKYQNDFTYSISVLATVAQAVICYLTPQLSPHIHLSFISFTEVFSTENGALYYPCLLVVEHSGEKMRASRCFCVDHQLDPSLHLPRLVFHKKSQRTCFSFIFYFGLKQFLID